MEPFKVGDEVRCVPGGAGGAGYKKDLVFKITKISNDTQRDLLIYWGGEYNHGVYEDSVESAAYTENDIAPQPNLISSISRDTT